MSNLVEQILKESEPIKLNHPDKDKIKEAIEAIGLLGYVNPLNPKEIVIKNKVLVELSCFNNSLFINSIRSIEKGGGRLGMDIILQVADEYGIKCQVDVEPFGKNTALNKTKLKAWYKRLGFKPKYGDLMERLPQ